MKYRQRNFCNTGYRRFTYTGYYSAGKYEPVTVNNAPKIGDADYEYQGIESIRHAQQLTDTLMAIDAIFKIVSVVIIAILAIISISIIMNTIKLTVFIRKMKLVL